MIKFVFLIGVLVYAMAKTPWWALLKIYLVLKLALIAAGALYLAYLCWGIWYSVIVPHNNFFR